MDITALAVFVKDGKVLLEKRKEDEDNYAGFWAIPRGHKKGNELIDHTVFREMREELGIMITRYSELGVFNDIDPTSKHPYEHHAFLVVGWTGRMHEMEQEKVKWWKLDEFEKIPNHIPCDEKIIEKARAELKKLKF
jgi:ADP-ribose pyrophosphatase YjhB (NUDIX family)